MNARQALTVTLLGVFAAPLAPPAPLGGLAPSVRAALLLERAEALAAERDESAAADTADEFALLVRWNRLTPAEQGKLRERFEEFKTIDAPERERLKQRGERLDSLARHLYRELSEEDRARMDALPADKRRELMREMAGDKAREVGQRVHGKLPPSLRRRLEQASAEDRARFLEEFKARQRARMGAALVRLGAELEIDESIIKRISNLPDDQRARKFMEFLQRRALVAVGRDGLPAGLTLETWQSMWHLPGEEFFEAVMALRETYPTLAMPPREIREMSEAKRRLIFAGRPRHAERIELSEWSPAERRREIGRRRRERVELVLRADQLLSEAEREELSRLPDGAFFAEVRSRIFARETADAVSGAGLEQGGPAAATQLIR